MPAYRIIAYKLATLRSEYHVEADSPQSARTILLERPPVEAFAQTVCEFNGAEYIESVTVLEDPMHNEKTSAGLLAALKTMLNTEHIREYLKVAAPQALEQADSLVMAIEQRTSQDTLRAAFTILKGNAARASFEYPGYIAIRIGTDKLLVGDANGYFGSEIEDLEGNAISDINGVATDIHLPFTTSAAELAQAVENLIAQLEAQA